MLRRFTPAGGFVLAGLFLAASLTSNPEQTVAYRAFTATVALLLVALAFSPFFQVRLELQRRLPRFATLGEPLRYRVLLTNQTDQPESELDYLEDFGGDGLSYEEFAHRLRPGRARRSFRMTTSLPPSQSATAAPRSLPRLPSRGRVEVAVEILPTRRGPLHFTGAWVGRRDPLGLFRSLRRLRQPGTVLVLPRRYPVPLLALPGQTRYQQGGVNFASGVGESEEFVALREYRHGDSLRRVHWRASARLGRPVVREYQDEFFVRHALVLDTFCDVYRDHLFEEAVTVATSFACTVPDQDSLLDLLFVGPQTVCVTTGRGVGHPEQMLEVLACARPCREERFAHLEELVIRHSARVSGCVLVLLEWDEPRRGLVRKLKAQQIPVWVLQLVEPGEASMSPIGSPIEQPDRFARLEAGRVAEGLRELSEAPGRRTGGMKA